MIFLGPLCGVSDSEARVWIKGDVDSKYKVRYSANNSPAQIVEFTTHFNGVGVGNITGLTSNTEYHYDILDEHGAIAYTGGRFATFPSPDSHLDFRFGLFSCHNPDQPDSMEMWNRLSDKCHKASRPDLPGSYRFMLAVGDQVYADKPSEEYLKWYDMEQLELYFDEKYDLYWGYGAIRNVMARCPIYMTWDDHEIRDGWGSRQMDRPGANPMYAGAEKAYRRHQLLHNPFIAEPKTRKFYSFRYGQAGFIVLDLRSDRIMAHHQMMSEVQWRWLEAKLEEYGRNCDVIFIGLSTPFLHLRWSLNQLIEKLKKREIEDLWNADHWQKQGLRFADLIFKHHNTSVNKTRIFLLGGDVHVATCGEIIPHKGYDGPPIAQFTSSGISNTPSGIQKYIKSKDYFDMFDDPSPIRGRLPHIITKRNFGIIKLTTDATGKYRVRYDVHYQGDEFAKTLYDGEMLDKPTLVL